MSIPSGSEAQPPATPAPAAVPSFGLPPVQPAPPTYDPSLLMQVMPVSAAFAPVPPPRSGGRAAVVVLSVLLGLSVLAAGVFATLFLREGQESDRQSDRIAELQVQADELERRLDAADRNLDDADDDLADLQEERDALAECLNGFLALSNALVQTGGERTPEIEELALEVNRTCNAAEAYL